MQRTRHSSGHPPGAFALKASLALMAAIALAASLGDGCSGPDPQPWHTVFLDEEFEADMADEVVCLADYLALEDQTIELDLTPNRADCLGLSGVAREVALLTGSELADAPVTAQHLAEELEVRMPRLVVLEKQRPRKWNSCKKSSGCHD